MKRQGNTSVVVVLGALCLSSCTIQITPGLPDTSTANKSIDLSLDFAAGSRMQVNWIDGDIVVRIDPAADEVRITGTMSVAANTDDEATLLIAGVDIDLEYSDDDDNLIVASMSVPDVSIAASFSADVEIVVPAGLDLDIQHIAGNVTINGNDENTKIVLLAGDVEVTGQSGGDIEIEVDSGDVHVDSSAGDVVMIIEVGTATVQASPAGGGRVQVVVNIGDADLSIAPDFGAILDLDASNGTVSANLDGFAIIGLNVTGNSLTATLGDGEGSIDVNVTSGDISFQPLEN